MGEEEKVDITKLTPEELLKHTQELQEKFDFLTEESNEKDGVVKELTEKLEANSEKLKKANVSPSVRVKNKSYMIVLEGQSTFKYKGNVININAQMIQKDKDLAEALVAKGVKYMVPEK